MEKVIHFEEFIERDEPKPRTYEIIDDAVNSLNLPGRFSVIDRALNQESAAQELAERLREYDENLENKQIGEKNSVMDVVENLELSLGGIAERANKKGLSDVYKKIIVDNSNTLNNYLSLLRDYPHFEKAELANEDGFLRHKLKKEDLEKLRSDKIKYVQECKKILEGETAKRAA